MVKWFLWVSGYSYGVAETGCARDDNEPHQRIDPQHSPGRYRRKESREVVQKWNESQVQGEDVSHALLFGSMKNKDVQDNESIVKVVIFSLAVFWGYSILNIFT